MVLGNNVLTELGIGLGRLLLHIADGFLGGKEFRKREECGLKNGVLYLHVSDVVLCDRRCVDDIEIDAVIRYVGLNGGGKMLFELLGLPEAVEKERSARLYIVDDLKAFEYI